MTLTDEQYLEVRILVKIISKKVLQALEMRLASTDASVSGLQFAVMRALSIEEHTISDLSRHFLLDPSTLVPTVDALERKGLAVRGRDPNDRRRVPISLTERGADFVASVPLVDAQDPLFQSLTLMGDERCQQLQTLLRDLVGLMPDGDEILRTVSSRIHSQVDRVAAVPR
jgi:DNA-binding MarR family transcriptional regulator